MLFRSLDTSTVSAYVLFIDSGANFGLQISLGGALSELVPSVDLPFNATSEVVIELEMVGSQISGYAWQVGTAKPAVPQLTVTDNTLPSGKAGLAYDEDDDNTIGVFRFATAQGTPILAPVCDFNGDVRCDIADMDLLTKEVATHGTEAVFDLTGDSQVTIADMDQWRATAGGLNIGANRPYREGDANLDGAVDGTDFGLWNANKFTVTGQWSKGDFNADNSSDGSDFGIWNANKFTSSDGSLVPEPTSLAFLLTGSLLCAALRLRKI